MTLHHTVAWTLDRRAAEVAQDIENTEAAIRLVRGGLEQHEAVLASLREEEQAIADARNLLERLTQEDT